VEVAINKSISASELVDRYVKGDVNAGQEIEYHCLKNPKFRQKIHNMLIDRIKNKKGNKVMIYDMNYISRAPNLWPIKK
jgi:hypothetical protein